MEHIRYQKIHYTLEEKEEKKRKSKERQKRSKEQISQYLFKGTYSMNKVIDSDCKTPEGPLRMRCNQQSLEERDSGELFELFRTRALLIATHPEGLQESEFY